MGARQSTPPVSPSPSTPSLSPLSLSPLTPLTPSNMCEDSRKQVEKIIRATEELNISRDQKIGLHTDFKKQLADANAAFKRMPESDNNIQFVANMQSFDEKHALLEDERMKEMCTKREELTASRSGRIGSSFHRRRFFCSYLL